MDVLWGVRKGDVRSGWKEKSTKVVKKKKCGFNTSKVLLGGNE